MLLGLLQCDLSGDLLAKLEAFERNLSQYGQRSGEVMSDSVRIGVVNRVDRYRTDNAPRGECRKGSLHVRSSDTRLWTHRQQGQSRHERRFAWPMRDEPDGRGGPERATQIPLWQDRTSGERRLAKQEWQSNIREGKRQGKQGEQGRQRKEGLASSVVEVWAVSPRLQNM